MNELCDELLSGSRLALSRAITLVESSLPKHRKQAEELLAGLAPKVGTGLRIGISGVPGVGKSTFIDALGCSLIDRGQRVAVLAVDPSSIVSGGSVLGDKTRMQSLAADPRAFVRPSPTRGVLGGVAERTLEAAWLCEAAGFSTVIVETVGVGQSEIEVRQIVDHFLVLMLAGAGDGLQGIKRGILEVADRVAINKADGENLIPAQRAKQEYEMALRLMRGEKVDVHLVSALEKRGIDEVWKAVEETLLEAQSNGSLASRRAGQRVHAMWKCVDRSFRDRLLALPGIQGRIDAAESAVQAGRSVTEVAMELMAPLFETT